VVHPPAGHYDNSPNHEREIRCEAIRKTLGVVGGVIFGPNATPATFDARRVVARWRTFESVVGLDGRSLGEIASELNCSRAWLSKIGRQISDELELSAPWQKTDNERAECAFRAEGVHAGTWQPQDKSERDRIRREQVAKTRRAESETGGDAQR
jgi:hypothetical protein